MDKRLLTLLLVCMCAIFGMQARTVKGTVVDQVNQPVIGASVHVNGTTIGTMTDVNGNFTLSNVPDNAVITFDYVGMASQSLAASDNMQVQLADDFQKLDDVVVIGYGSAKAKDLTAPIAVVKGDELLSTPTSSVMNALQGKVAGVNVISNGTPGEGPTVQIRGVGSFANSTPLYVVDGMFYDNINFLNSADIQEMSVLKDASAAAIYGVRAANGVVIITTKKGAKNADAKITYDGYFGIQKASNVLKECNSQEYATMMLEGNYDSYVTHFKQSIDRYGGSYADADFHNWTYAADNNWYDLLLRTAAITSHGINISGGSEKATYTLGGNYLYQNGIMDVDNNYKRFNLRAAVDYDATKWLTVGFNGLFSQSTQQVPNNAAWQKAFNCPPIVGLYDEKNENAFPIKYGSPDALSYTSNFYNPVAFANYYNNKNKGNQVLSNFYAQINFIPSKLFFKTNYSYSFASNNSRAFTPAYYVSAWQQATTTSLTKTEVKNYNSIWDNTLTYNEQVGLNHFGVMLGASVREENYRMLSGTTTGVPEGEEEYWYIKNGNATGATVTDAGTTYRGMSYFARLNYNYDEKYLLMLTMRADGSSKYQEKWGYFPSVGAAWVISKENFMQNQNVFDYLKLRASWGKLGNDHVAASDGFASITTGNKASGVFGNTTIAGYQDNSYFSYLKWEVVDEFNAGLNFSTLNNRLNVDVDYYHRMTNNAVISPLLPFSTTTLAGNYGKILNCGVDVNVTWNDRIGKDFKYNIGLNLSTIKNRVKDLGGQTIIKGGKTVNMVGEQMNSFYGFERIGVYQNEAECAADPIAVANGLVPGDLKYKDQNNDGKIDGNDRVCLGSYIPNIMYGVNFGFEYKNLDFTLTTYGQAGAQMFNRKRALRYASQNYNFDKAQYDNRWHGEGTSNTDPSAAGLLKAWNVSDQRYSSYFVEDADFFRIQNITLGYTVKNIKMGSYTLPSLRLSLTADRPFTSFSANTFSPELSDAQGWDTEVYPLTSTYTLGLQINF